MTNSSPLTRSQIKANRQKWIERLCDSRARKAKTELAETPWRMCCLGHGCEALGINFVWHAQYEEELTHQAGLWGDIGKSQNGSKLGKWDEWALAIINDKTNATPQQIGAYLRTVIEGGEDTPFRPLTDYPEERAND